VQFASDVQVVRHDGFEALHWYGLHACVVGAGQLPLPSQLAAGEKVLPPQLASLHPVAVDHGRQAPAPLHVPSFEQSPPMALLARQRFLGSAPPAGTGEQVPTLPGTLQLKHRPPVVASLHALSQQTPSVQKVLVHCDPAVQLAPFALRPHELPAQVLGGTQSASLAQLFLHAAELQTYVPHGLAGGVTHAPSPSQAETGVSDEAVAQAASLQLSPLLKLAHAPALHRPVVPQVFCGVALHFSCGSGAPSATAVQSPSEADRLHAMHAPVHSELQHVPCAQ